MLSCFRQTPWPPAGTEVSELRGRSKRLFFLPLRRSLCRCGLDPRAPPMAGQRVEVDGGIMEGVSAERGAGQGWWRCKPLLGRRASLSDDVLSLLSYPLPWQGGQILRVSTALSCLLGLPLRVQKIRAGRSTPGLR